MVKNKTAVIAKKLHILHIIITKNNLKVSLMLDGDVVFKKSEGSLKGIRKGSINSPDTSLIMMGYVATLIRNLKIHSVGIYIRGATRWKKFSLRRFLTKLKGKVSIKFIKDITGTPHNGCFPVKKRRKRKRRHLKVKNFIQYNITKKERLWKKYKKEVVLSQKEIINSSILSEEESVNLENGDSVLTFKELKNANIYEQGFKIFKSDWKKKWTNLGLRFSKNKIFRFNKKKVK